MDETVLIVPGFHGSGPAHWQSWLQARTPQARRVSGIDWESPVLPEWSSAIHAGIEQSTGSVWLVAHSFGCLASVVAASERPDRIAGLLLVAPADPERFSSSGVRQQSGYDFVESSIVNLLPQSGLERLPSVVVASEDDPWLDFENARDWAERWGSSLINLGQAGHINTDSGYGPWPFAQELLLAMHKGRTPALTEADANDLSRQIERLESSQGWRSFSRRPIEFAW